MQQTPHRPDYRPRLRDEWERLNREIKTAHREQIAGEIRADAEALAAAMADVFRREIAAGNADTVPGSNGQTDTARPQPGAAGIAIDPDTLYSRQTLLSMGIPRRMIDAPEIRAAAVRTNGRFMYTGSRLKAAMEAHAAEQRRIARPVPFRGSR